MPAPRKYPDELRDRAIRLVQDLLADPEVDTVPLIDLKSGYVLRSLDKLPKQGPAAPWRLYQNYPRDVLLMRHGPLTDDVRFERVRTAASV